MEEDFKKYHEKLFIDIFTSMMEDDYHKILKNITNKFGEQYNFTLEELKEEFPFSGVRFMEKVNKEKELKRRISSMKSFYENDKKNWSNRCIARTMPENGQVPPFVYYSKKETNWIIGIRCRNKAKPNCETCGIHVKSMPYGRFDRTIPLCQYEKYMYPINK